jgi:hypothetical protein
MVHFTFRFVHWSLKSELLFAVSAKAGLAESCRAEGLETTQLSMLNSVAGVWNFLVAL